MQTALLSKQQLMQTAQQNMNLIQEVNYTDRQKLALTCRILFDHGHDAGLAGQITCRAEQENSFITKCTGQDRPYKLSNNCWNYIISN